MVMEHLKASVQRKGASTSAAGARDELLKPASSAHGRAAAMLRRIKLCSMPAAGEMPAMPHQLQEVRVDLLAAGRDTSSSASVAAPEEWSAGGIPTARTLFAISSSPYSARRESANLDASIIEVERALCCALETSFDKVDRCFIVVNSGQVENRGAWRFRCCCTDHEQS